LRGHSINQCGLLANDVLEVKIVPDEGGRIRSLSSRITGTKFLTQAAKETTYPEAGFDVQFQKNACAGVDECLSEA